MQEKLEKDIVYLSIDSQIEEKKMKDWSFFLGQLWQHEDGKLKNQNGISIYSGRKWKIPKEDKMGTIEDEISGKVLQVNLFGGVSLIDKGFNGFEMLYNWKRSKADGQGWFRLRNLYQNKYLSARSKKEIIATG